MSTETKTTVDEEVKTEESEAVETESNKEERAQTTEPNEPEVQAEESEAQTEESEEAQDEKSEEKKGLGKKKKDPKDEIIADLTDRVKRQLAEFENFRNRTDKEKASMYEMGAKSVVEKILPIIDNFERGLEHAPEDPFAEGMKMVYKQIITELESIGVKPIDAVGTDFDPNIHNAVMQVASDEYESGKVAQELQKGYMYRDTLVRPSMVAVVE